MDNKVPSKAIAIAFLMMLAGSLNSYADTNHYRWLNERGEPVYSDRPPPKGVDYEVMSTASTFKRVVSGDEGAVPLDVEPKVGNDFTQVDSDQANRSKKNAELCERAKSNLQVLENADVVNARNDQGELRPLSDKQRAVQAQTAQSQINIYCE